jgi:hypothetical protein
VQPHKELYNKDKNLTKEGLMKVPKELTISEKRKYELLIKVILIRLEAR